MSLRQLLSSSPSSLGADNFDLEEITEERLRENLDFYRKAVAYWRLYPDRLIDFYCAQNPDNTFHMFFYQRLFLRVIFRHKYVYATFVRAWSKSFMSVMALMLRAILYPNARLFTVAGGKEQSASILSSKILEICRLIPAMEKEIIWDTRGTKETTRQTKDSVIYTFKNGSILENVAANEKTRGRRFHSGLMEECVSIDQNVLNEIIIPTMNVDRMVNSTVDSKEKLNKSQIYITTAGYKSTFSYNKLIQILCMSVARPNDAMILGGSWRTPVAEGLLNKNFVRELRLDGTFNEASFEREYESKWTGDVESAFFDTSKFAKYRDMLVAEYSYNKNTSAQGFYIMGVDVGRFGCSTEVAVIKVTPHLRNRSIYIKKLVNLFSFQEEHFGMQAIQIKRIFNAFDCKIAVIDGNGIGGGLVDFLTMDNFDPDSGETLWNWGVYNDEERRYKNMETANTIHNAMFIMKANAPLNTEMYSYCQTQMSAGLLHFLIDENTAKNKLLAQVQGQKMTQSQRADYLLPYTQTSILRDQMANLVSENDGVNIILKQNNRKIAKDKFSAFIYALYWCMTLEKKSQKHRSRNFSKMMFYTKH